MARMSLPSRERGLKSTVSHLSTLKQTVAPFAGAWIEILLNQKHKMYIWSLPSRERGLKSLAAAQKSDYAKSLPSRERGLK